MANKPSVAAGKTAAPASTTHAATGVVKQVDAADSKVVIAHEAIKTLEWPAMSMGFAVKDKELFRKLAVGKKVDFQIAKEGNDYVLVGVK
jgi:Cu(I)/Ag(I) efflux system periplasmic protein CusF